MKILVLAGDGIGAEVTAQAVRILDAVAGALPGFERADAPIGADALAAHGDPLPAPTLDMARKADQWKAIRSL